MKVAHKATVGILTEARVKNEGRENRKVTEEGSKSNWDGAPKLLMLVFMDGRSARGHSKEN